MRVRVRVRVHPGSSVSRSLCEPGLNQRIVNTMRGYRQVSQSRAGNSGVLQQLTTCSSVLCQNKRDPVLDLSSQKPQGLVDKREIYEVHHREFARDLDQKTVQRGGHCRVVDMVETFIVALVGARR